VSFARSGVGRAQKVGLLVSTTHDAAERIAVIGQGYVGLPVTLAFGEAFEGVVGFDTDAAKITRLRAGHDPTGEAPPEELARTTVEFTADEADLKGATFFVVAVPTPIDAVKRPDLGPLASASLVVGRALTRGAVVVFESTVYPGVTEEFCGPILEETSGLKAGIDFTLGYSPERINPGDKEHTLRRIVKVVAGQDAPTLERVAGVYGAIIEAGVYRASSIKVAEAAKVIENTQRDLNIALMNELAMIFDRLDINTLEVLEAAGTKWNFLPFRPGLVGGHCIGVDPYYLTTKAEEVGYIPQVILAGRRINDGMGAFVAQKVVKLLASAGGRISGARVGVLGLTFKENVPDLRNSRVPDILEELAEYGVTAVVHDGIADAAEARREYGVELADLSEFQDLDALIIAVAHRGFDTLVLEELPRLVKPGGIVADVKSVLKGAKLPAGFKYWSL
jgi:UDP-N-acetyl-D-galactosamine dehydrogenase